MLAQVLGSQVAPGFLDDAMSYNSLTARIFLKSFCLGKCCRSLWQPVTVKCDVIRYQKIIISFDWVGHTPAITFAVASRYDIKAGFFNTEGI